MAFAMFILSTVFLFPLLFSHILPFTAVMEAYNVKAIHNKGETIL